MQNAQWTLVPHGVIPGPAASAQLGNLPEMKILKLYLRPGKSESLGWGLEVCTSSPGDSNTAKVWKVPG